MIVEIEGLVGEKAASAVVIHTAQGLGYGVEVPRETEQRLPPRGEKVHLFTHLIVREDQWRLIGFYTVQERQVFLDLLDVNGVGIKGALSVMSHLGIERLRRAVFNGDWKELKGASGIGAKIAQRIQLELASRWVKGSEPPGLDWHTAVGGEESETSLDEVVSALISLGYERGEAEAAVRPLAAEPAEARLRGALKALDRGRAR